MRRDVCVRELMVLSLIQYVEYAQALCTDEERLNGIGNDQIVLVSINCKANTLPLQSFLLSTMPNQNFQQFINYRPSSYSKALRTYQRHTFKKIHPFIKIITLSSNYSHKYPLYQMLKACVKLLMLNELELVMMFIFIKTTKWDIHSDIIKHSCEEIGEMICSSNSSKEYKQLNLYLLLVGWGAKMTMNQDCKLVLDQIRKLCFHFKSIFQNWLLPNQHILTVHPCVFNRIYSTFISPQQPTHTSTQDYQLMVDAILQISHQYTRKESQTQSIINHKSTMITQSLKIEQKEVQLRQQNGCSAIFVPFQLNHNHNVVEVNQSKVESLFVFGSHSMNNNLEGMRMFHSSIIGDMFGGCNLDNKNSLGDNSYFEVELGGEGGWLEGGWLEMEVEVEVEQVQLSNIFGLKKSDSMTQRKQQQVISGYFP